MAQHPVTPTASAVDVLSMTDNVNFCKLVQLLAKLETVQILVAQCKVLNHEEENIAEIEDTAVLKLDTAKARLAPALNDFHFAIRDFSVFLANVSIGDSSVFSKYKFAETSQKLTAFYDEELALALGRWHSALEKVAIHLKGVIPEDWKSKAFEGFDLKYVEAKILSKH